MNKPSISIIVPIYNVAPYVEDCIKSVMRQKYDGQMECILVDDCSTDDSMAIVERLIAEYTGPIEFRILHHTHNRGLSAARNTGIDAAKGDYLFFLDSDDEITDDCLEELAEPLKTELYDVVMGNVRCYKILPSGQKERVNNHLELNITEDTKLTPPMVMRTISIWHNMTAWNRLFRKEFIADNHLRFKEGIIYEDHLWSFQIACLASSFFVLKQITYHYNLREGSISSGYNIQVYLKNLEIILQEMRQFVDYYQIEKYDSFSAFRFFFNKMMSYHSSTLSDYVLNYRKLRPYVKAPLKHIIHENGFHIKAYFHDLHYMLPLCFAPYWQFIFYRKICYAMSQIKKD